VADEAIATMNEVIDIEREVADADRERETKLVRIRTRLVRACRASARRD